MSWRPNLFIGRTKTLATCSEDGTVKVWDMNNDKQIVERTKLQLHGTVWRVQWNPLGTMLAVCISNDKDHFETKLYSEDKDGRIVEVAKSE